MNKQLSKNSALKMYSLEGQRLEIKYIPALHPNLRQGEPATHPQYTQSKFVSGMSIFHKYIYISHISLNPLHSLNSQTLAMETFLQRIASFLKRSPWKVFSFKLTILVRITFSQITPVRFCESDFINYNFYSDPQSD